MALHNMRNRTPGGSIYSSRNALSSASYIRLLEVHSAKDGEPIICNLSAVDLNEQPVFYALSYVWGVKGESAKAIHCNGLIFEVTDNCHAALVHIRRRYGGSKLWVDALCINQNDEREKEHQIILMSRIYASSKRTIIWLGSGTTASDRAMTYIEKSNTLEDLFRGRSTNIYHVWMAILKIYVKRWDPRNHVQYMKAYRSQSKHDPAHELSSSYLQPQQEIVHALADIFNREWIHRIWTYQEVICGHDPVIMCGNRLVNWTRFYERSVTLYFIARQNRTVAPLASILANWNEVGLMKDQLSRVDGRPKRLGEYRQFILEIASILLTIRTMARLLAIATAFTTIVFIGLYGDCLRTQQQVQGKPIIAPDGTLVEWPGCGPRFNWPIGLLSSVLIVLIMNFLASLWSGQSFVTPYATQDPIFGDSEADIVNTVCFRRAQNPKDKSFGLYAVLERVCAERPPLPDYGRLTSGIYRDLALQICRSHTKTQLLTAAAEHQLIGGPSWVPDWSGVFSVLWHQSELTQNSLNTATPSSHRRRFKHTVEPSGDVLQVLGKRLCYVDECMEFQQTAESYEDVDEAKHLHNLDIMMQMYSPRRTYNKKQKNSKLGFSILHDGSTPKELTALVTNLEFHPDLSANFAQDDLEDYHTFLRNHCNEDNHRILQLLKSNEYMQPKTRLGSGSGRQIPYASIFQTHIAFCNSMCAAGRKFFATTSCIRLKNAQSYSKNLSLELYTRAIPRIRRRQLVRGICTDRVQVGDKVILVAGNHLPLVVREREQHSVSLVSPAIIFGVMQGQAWPGVHTVYGYRDAEFPEELETIRIS